MRACLHRHFSVCLQRSHLLLYLHCSLAGGLAWVGVLTFGVLSEQIKTRIEQGDEVKSSQVKALAVNLACNSMHELMANLLLCRCPPTCPSNAGGVRRQRSHLAKRCHVHRSQNRRWLPCAERLPHGSRLQVCPADCGGTNCRQHTSLTFGQSAHMHQHTPMLTCPPAPHPQKSKVSQLSDDMHTAALCTATVQLSVPL